MSTIKPANVILSETKDRIITVEILHFVQNVHKKIYPNRQKMTREKNVILNEVKNLFCGLTFCYDAILHFVQNDRKPICHCETPMNASNRRK